VQLFTNVLISILFISGSNVFAESLQQIISLHSEPCNQLERKVGDARTRLDSRDNQFTTIDDVYQANNKHVDALKTYLASLEKLISGGTNHRKHRQLAGLEKKRTDTATNLRKYQNAVEGTYERRIKNLKNKIQELDVAVSEARKNLPPTKEELSEAKKIRKQIKTKLDKIEKELSVYRIGNSYEVLEIKKWPKPNTDQKGLSKNEIKLGIAFENITLGRPAKIELRVGGYLVLEITPAVAGSVQHVLYVRAITVNGEVKEAHFSASSFSIDSLFDGQYKRGSVHVLSNDTGAFSSMASSISDYIAKHRKKRPLFQRKITAHILPVEADTTDY